MEEEKSWWDKFLDSASSIGGDTLDYLSSPKGVSQIGSLGVSALADKLGWNDPKIPTTGYQGGVPELQAMRQQVPVGRGAELQGGAVLPMGSPGGIGSLPPTGRSVPMAYDPNRRPGSGGRRYFTDTEYVARNADTAPAQQRQDEQLEELMQQNIDNPAREQRAGTPAQPIQKLAEGGLASLKGRKKVQGKYLNGASDGMADEIPAEIEGEQAAALSHGEFVVPADVVSHLGNGNSEAGAKVLEQMMARVRKTRTGSEKQGKQIEPNRLLPM